MRIRGDVNIYNLIHRLKHGYETPSLVNWVSFSRSQIVVGVLGLTGLILVVRDRKTGCLSGSPSTSKTSDSSEKLRFVAGLRNLGNNCFLNVILQALASCDFFLPFLENIIEEDGLSVEERVESVPFTVDLFALLKELCILRDERVVLNPRRVMLAMDHYIPGFNLTKQQDAAEAFLHLLSSLKEEFSECYVPHNGSLADISAFRLCRISIPKREGRSERERWQRHFLGPFNGILCSNLTCRSCSCQLSMDFEFFHSLPLPSLLDSIETSMDGCSIEDCLRQYTAAELIENYRCNRCWHIAAVKYLSSTGGNETHIEKIKFCIEQDSCECRNLFPHEGMRWSNDFSCTIKQLRIARCPKILCIHLQRASVNEFGELVKLQGHISFPMVLDLFPFTKDAVGVGIESVDDKEGRMQVKKQQPSIPHLKHFRMQFDTQMLRHMYGMAGEHLSPETLVGDELGGSINETSVNKCVQAFEGESVRRDSDCSDLEVTGIPLQSDSKFSKSCLLLPSKSYMYRLVSVVEHFGRVGSGHYTVYRRVMDESNGEDSVGQSEPAHVRWFCVSDSEVLSVSEEDVLTAEASLLFYERIET